nr:MAG TPA: hypothetical protein [Caudoviricetes sp.]
MVSFVAKILAILVVSPLPSAILTPVLATVKFPKTPLLMLSTNLLVEIAFKPELKDGNNIPKLINRVCKRSPTVKSSSENTRPRLWKLDQAIDKEDKAVPAFTIDAAKSSV